MTDVQRIVDYLSSGRTLTSLQGQKMFNMPDFRKRVSDARRRWIKILDRWEPGREGRSRYKVYFMKEAQDE